MLRNNYGLDGIINRATNSNNYHGISNGYVSATAPV